MKNDAYKNSLIQLIHVGRRDLRLAEDDYRAMLVEQTGKNSAAKLGIRDLEKVVEHLKSRGFVIRAKPKGKAAPARRERIPQSGDQVRKIRSLWLELRDLGVLRDSSEAALGKYVKRIVGVDRLEWLGSLEGSQVIETLKQWVERIKDKSLQEMG